VQDSTDKDTTPTGGTATREPGRATAATGSKRPRTETEDSAMATQDDQMLEDHKRTYQAFLRLLGYSTLLIVIVLIFMALFLT